MTIITQALYIAVAITGNTCLAAGLGMQELVRHADVGAGQDRGWAGNRSRIGGGPVPTTGQELRKGAPNEPHRRRGRRGSFFSEDGERRRLPRDFGRLADRCYGGRDGCITGAETSGWQSANHARAAVVSRPYLDRTAMQLDQASHQR